MHLRGLAFGLVALTLSACTVVPPPTVLAPVPVRSAVQSPRPAPLAVAAVTDATARSAGAVEGPAVATLAITGEQASRALTAFRSSCAALRRRTDTSQLTLVGAWDDVCTAAATATDARAFFIERFETARIGDGRAFATGYYEPEIAGSRTRDADHTVPIYAKPTDLIELDLGNFSASLKGKSVRGRVLGTSFVPYYNRSDIENGALAGRALELAWAADAIELFFLQVQGSGRLRLPDGSTMRIGYAGQNGRDYTGIGALMRDRGLVGPGQLSMQGIMAWLRANPEQGRAIMRENKSWVFFREIIGQGPIGSLNVPVVARASIAVDPAFIPLGAPVWLDLDRTEASGLWVAQDTGGAIKGSNRVDTFWGAGDEARWIAGGMSGRGSALVLLPRGTLARLAGDATRPDR